MAWIDKVKACVGWSEADQARISEVRCWLDSDASEIIEGLGMQLAQFKGMQPLMTNARFARRMHDVLREWLVGLLDGSFDETHVEERWTFGRRVMDLDLTFRDFIMLEGLARRQLFELARRELGEEPERLSLTMRTLDKALNVDLALIYSSYVQARDTEMERALLDRFLDITGFSPTLYENLAEARKWEEERQ